MRGENIPPPQDQWLQSQLCRVNTECIQAPFSRSIPEASAGKTYSTSFHIRRPLSSVWCVNVLRRSAALVWSLSECGEMSHREVTGEIQIAREPRAFCFITSAKSPTPDKPIKINMTGCSSKKRDSLSSLFTVLFNRKNMRHCLIKHSVQSKFVQAWASA